MNLLLWMWIVLCSIKSSRETITNTPHHTPLPSTTVVQSTNISTSSTTIQTTSSLPIGENITASSYPSVSSSNTINTSTILPNSSLSIVTLVPINNSMTLSHVVDPSQQSMTPITFIKNSTKEIDKLTFSSLTMKKSLSSLSSSLITSHHSNTASNVNATTDDPSLVVLPSTTTLPVVNKSTSALVFSNTATSEHFRATGSYSTLSKETLRQDPSMSSIKSSSLLSTTTGKQNLTYTTSLYTKIQQTTTVVNPSATRDKSSIENVIASSTLVVSSKYTPKESLLTAVTASSHQQSSLQAFLSSKEDNHQTTAIINSLASKTTENLLQTSSLYAKSEQSAIVVKSPVSAIGASSSTILSTSKNTNLVISRSSLLQTVSFSPGLSTTANAFESLKSYTTHEQTTVGINPSMSVNTKFSSSLQSSPALQESISSQLTTVPLQRSTQSKVTDSDVTNSITQTLTLNSDVKSNQTTVIVNPTASSVVHKSSSDMFNSSTSVYVNTKLVSSRSSLVDSVSFASGTAIITKSLVESVSSSPETSIMTKSLVDSVSFSSGTSIITKSLVESVSFSSETSVITKSSLQLSMSNKATENVLQTSSLYKASQQTSVIAKPLTSDITSSSFNSVSTDNKISATEATAVLTNIATYSHVSASSEPKLSITTTLPSAMSIPSASDSQIIKTSTNKQLPITNTIVIKPSTSMNILSSPTVIPSKSVSLDVTGSSSVIDIVSSLIPTESSIIIVSPTAVSGSSAVVDIVSSLTPTESSTIVVSSTAVSGSSSVIDIVSSLTPTESSTIVVSSTTVVPVVTKDKEVIMMLRIPSSVNISTPQFKTSMEANLTTLYEKGKTQANRRRRNTGDPKIETVITDVARRDSSPTNVDLKFYVKEDQVIVNSQQVEKVFEKISLPEMDNQLGYTVITKPTSQQTVTTAEDDSLPTWIIIVASLAPVIFLLLIINTCCYCRLKEARKKMQLHPLSGEDGVHTNNNQMNTEQQLMFEAKTQQPLQSSQLENRYVDHPTIMSPIRSSNYKKKKKRVIEDDDPIFFDEVEQKQVRYEDDEKNGEKSTETYQKHHPFNIPITRKTMAGDVEDLTKGRKQFQANPLNRVVGVRLHTDIISPPSSTRSIRSGRMSSSPYHDSVDAALPPMTPLQLDDSLEHVKILDKISELQLTVESLTRGESAGRISEEMGELSQPVEVKKVDISKIRNKERMRKRELAKAERRLKKNEVIEMSSIETKPLEEEEIEEDQEISENEESMRRYQKKQDAVNKMLKKKKKKKMMSRRITPSLLSDDTESSPASLYSTDDDNKPFIETTPKRTSQKNKLPPGMVQYQGRLPPLKYQSPYLPAFQSPIAQYPASMMPGFYPTAAHVQDMPMMMYPDHNPFVAASPWRSFPYTPPHMFKESNIQAVFTSDDETSNSSGIVLPSGRGQPRKKIRRVTERDIESLERAQASARAKLKSVLDKASEEAREHSRTSVT